jgi:hypothetical protein
MHEANTELHKAGDRWTTEPRLGGLRFGDPTDVEKATRLWNDLTIASAFAILLWSAAAIVFG